jgi:hypothetical protein
MMVHSFTNEFNLIPYPLITMEGHASFAFKLNLAHCPLISMGGHVIGTCFLSYE